MRKQIKSFTLDVDIIKGLGEYAKDHSWSQSFAINKLLKVALGIKPIVIVRDNYIATPEEKAAADKFLANITKSKEDVDFENSIKESL